jgi:hypothetical protein
LEEGAHEVLARLEHERAEAGDVAREFWNAGGPASACRSPAQGTVDTDRAKG